jgi:hypothetical protein
MRNTDEYWERRSLALALRRKGMTLAQIGVALCVGRERARQLVNDGLKQERGGCVVFCHGWPTEIVNALVFAGVFDAGSSVDAMTTRVRQLSDADLLAIRNIGKRRLHLLRELTT